MRLPSHPRARVNLARIILCLSWLTLLHPGVVAGQEPACPGIHVTVLGIRNGVGAVDCALFDAPTGFPVDVLHSTRVSIHFGNNNLGRHATHIGLVYGERHRDSRSVSFLTTA